MKIILMKRFFCICIAAVLSPFSVNVSAVAPCPDKNDISARAAVVIEASTGRTVWGKNENKKLPMASTTKIMSALLTLESGDLDADFTVDSTAVHTEGSSMGLREGDIVSKRDLCIGMLLPSGNDAANCAAVRVAGDIQAFADMMNSRADELGLFSTHFVTPSGLHDDNHYSTAHDMARLAAYALKNPDFAAICSKQSIALDFGAPPFDRTLINTNKLLKKYDGCIGMKTGFTDEAGRCLVSAAERDGVRLICVTLNAPDDWNDHTKLLDYGFSAVKMTAADVPVSFDVTLAGGYSPRLTVNAAETPMLPVIGGKEIAPQWKAVVPQRIYAPVRAGDVIGELIIYDNENEMCRIPLTAAENAAVKVTELPKKSCIDSVTDWLKEYLFR